METPVKSNLQLELPFSGQPLQEGPNYDDPLKPNRERLVGEILEDAQKKAKQSYEDLLSLGFTRREASANLLNAYVDLFIRVGVHSGGD
jgi:hypothetical protein